MTTSPINAPKRRWRITLLILIFLVACAIAGVAYLLTSVFQHKMEAKNPYLRFVEVTENTTDPEPWGINWPREYDQYKKTVTPTKTNFGGGDAGITTEKAVTFPFLTRMFAGYAFSLDYRDRRGHAYMLLDQEHTRRVTDRPQPGSCLNCHTSITPTYRRLGDGDVQAGFVKLCMLPYQQAHDEVVKTGSLNATWNGTTQQLKHVDGAHPVSCLDCHDPQSMRLRVTRPAFINGIKALKKHEGIEDYDPNRDATRQEMRSYVCAQCHVNYYCGPKIPLLFPWGNGVQVQEVEAYYENFKFPPDPKTGEQHRFYDFIHSETGAEILKARHPEFETWSQGIHARSGVTCADCHMPYTRFGAMKVSDHWVRSPLLMVNNSCQQCHQYPEEEIKARVHIIQTRNFDLLQRAGKSCTDMLDAVKIVRAPFDEANRPAADDKAKAKLAADEAFAKLSPEEQTKKLQSTAQSILNDLWAANVAKTPELHALGELHRKAQWRLDYVAAENSMGFHAPQETARILGESIDYFRQAQLAAQKLAPPPH